MPVAPFQHDFRTVFFEQSPFVMRALSRHGVFGHDADDLCQEVFLVVHRRLSEFEGRSSMSTWIYGITTRTVASHRNRAHVRREIPTQELPEQRGPEDPARDLLANEGLRLLQSALGSLSPAKREAFALYELEQLTMREVAEAMGCPEKTVLSRIHAARREISAFVKRREHDSPPSRWQEQAVTRGQR